MIFFLKKNSAHQHHHKLTQLKLLIQRTFINTFLRQNNLFKIYMYTSIISSIYLSLIYYSLDIYIGGVQDRFGYFFFLIFFYTFLSLSSIDQFYHHLLYYQYEISLNKANHQPLLYIIHLFITDYLPFRVIPTIIYCLITYFLIELNLANSGIRLLNYIIITILVHINAVSYIFLITILVTTGGSGPKLSRSRSLLGQSRSLLGRSLLRSLGLLISLRLLSRLLY